MLPCLTMISKDVFGYFSNCRCFKVLLTKQVYQTFRNVPRKNRKKMRTTIYIYIHPVYKKQQPYKTMDGWRIQIPSWVIPIQLLLFGFQTKFLNLKQIEVHQGLGSPKQDNVWLLCRSLSSRENHPNIMNYSIFMPHFLHFR